MSRSVDGTMSRLCGRLMSCAQNAIDSQNYILEEMDIIAEQNPEREDIKACINDIKNQCKSNEATNWATANHWSDHFDGIDAGDQPTAEDTAVVSEEKE